MILQGDFYTISDLQAADAVIQAELILNAGHKIYEGHFPGQPVTPGVCMMQMIKEIVETVLQRETRLVHANEMKFLLMIIPGENNAIRAQIKYTVVESEGIQVTASLLKDSTTYFKFKGLFSFR